MGPDGKGTTGSEERAGSPTKELRKNQDPQGNKYTVPDLFFAGIYGRWGTRRIRIPGDPVLVRIPLTDSRFLSAAEERMQVHRSPGSAALIKHDRANPEDVLTPGFRGYSPIWSYRILAVYLSGRLIFTRRGYG
ncbi:hypothetical protein GEV33_008882 [Tenebrio molitor]|uniref:Uncharacterized protein n=1 Tax=Tenebrio molitor TaxID=7067 RepID=A0A8J6HGV0_TENMO|nr:hypothetical protein GEV33_008882 [Tenebrio molitor]